MRVNAWFSNKTSLGKYTAVWESVTVIALKRDLTSSMKFQLNSNTSRLSVQVNRKRWQQTVIWSWFRQQLVQIPKITTLSRSKPRAPITDKVPLASKIEDEGQTMQSTSRSLWITAAEVRHSWETNMMRAPWSSRWWPKVSLRCPRFSTLGSIKSRVATMPM